jgi:hypothetical protein
MLSGEATNTNFIVFGMTQLGPKPTNYRTHDEHANHYTTDAVTYYIKTSIKYPQIKQLLIKVTNL